MASDWAAKLATPSPEKKPKKRSETPPSEFNSQEVLEYMSSSYSSYITKAKDDKEGEKYKIYRSLESPNQWTSKSSSHKHTPKEVIRNRSGNNGTLDLLFEINRSVYQQRERPK